MKCLFLGGVADGERLEVDARPVWLVPVPVPRKYSAAKYEKPPEEPDDIETHSYHRVRFTDLDHTEFLVYSYDDDNLKPLARLILGYVATVK